MVVIWLLFAGIRAALYEPEQVHISYSSIDSEMYVTWASELPSFGAVVEYTPIASPTSKVISYEFSSAGTWTTFPNMAESKILQRQLHVCKATMQNLLAGHYYAYRVGSESYGWSDQYLFKAKRDFTQDPTARLLVYGDLGVGDQIVETVARLVEETLTYEYDAVVHNGDFAYDLDDEHGKRGDLFLRSIQPFASRIPYMVSQGNHESNQVLPHYINRFYMPGNVSNLWYSFNLGKAHIIAFNTEPIFDNLNQTQQAQMQFLINDLENYDKNKYPWLIVYGHRPLYCSPNVSNSDLLQDIPVYRYNPDCIQNAEFIRNTFEKLWFDYKVDVVIAGHVHAYERLGPVYQNNSYSCQEQNLNLCVEASAPVYMVTGVPGQNDCYAPVSPTPLPFSWAQDAELGYSRMTVFNDTHLLWEQVRSATKEVSDYFWLVKANSIQFE